MHPPERTQRRYRVRRLEPRIVLNATAELSVLGELLISGDGADDVLDIETNSNGRLEIRDTNGAVVPIRIAGGPVLVDSLAPSQITAERINVNLGGGDDILRVDLPESLDLTVVDGDGNDSVEVDIASNNNSAEVTLQIEAESIAVDGRSNALDLSSGSLAGVGPNGSITIENTLDLDLGTIQSTGEVTINANGTVTTELIEGANIDIVAAGPQSDILVGELKVNDPANGDIELTAGDDILRAGPNSPAVVANQLTLRAGNADVDGPNAIALNTQVNVLDAVVQGTNQGDLIVNEADDIRLALVDSTNNVTVEAQGNIAADVVQGESIRIVAGGPQSDIVVGDVKVNDPAMGDIELIAGDDILRVGPNSPNIIADQLTLRAGNGSADLDEPNGIELNTRVNVLDAVVQGMNEGDLIINETDDIRLTVLDASDGSTALATSNGSIRVDAGGSITVEDYADTDDGPRLTDNQDIIAGGPDGRIELIADGDFIAGDSVQLAVPELAIPQEPAPGSIPEDTGAITIQAQNVILGSDFEINVREGEGIARRFSPRPDPDGLQSASIQATNDPNATVPLDTDVFDTDTAFYDVDSVSTDILTQANENDAIGTLSIDIGAEGENGLVLSIDWGGSRKPNEAPAEFVQVVPGLPGNGTRHDEQHIYTQDDILNSLSNGRQSATDPLAVRFAVSHHRAIVVMGTVIQQPIDIPSFDTVSETVPGNLISSTDNPDTPETDNPGLESGRAFFTIPRIDVPVAFFPTRDVIPEAVDPPQPVLTSSVLMLSDVSLETAESSGTSITIREEYFQLRALSPDPAGEDLAEPVRLPESVLSGDNLSELFAKLPDGAYEVQYVLGDSDERTILRVDLRGGEPIIVGDDLDGGPLEIRWIDRGRDDSPIESDVINDQDDNETKDNPRLDESSDQLQKNVPSETDTSSAPASTNGVPIESGMPVAVAMLTRNPFSRASQFLMNSQILKPAVAPETDR